MTVEAVQAAEIRVLRALRLVALTVGDTMDDMSTITTPGNCEPALDVMEAQKKAWNRVGRLLRLTRGMISAIHENKGPAEGISAQIFGECEATIVEFEARQALARSQRFAKRIENENVARRH